MGLQTNNLLDQQLCQLEKAFVPKEVCTNALYARA